MAELVHPLAVEELGGWIRAMATTFMQDPGDPEAEAWIERLRREWEPERAWGVRDHGRWVATLRTEGRSLTVPGGSEIVVDALTNVTVAGTHRRQGWLRRMLGGSLAAARERGDAASVLIAAEWPIYGRFGYAPAVLSADYVLRRARAGSTVDGDLGRVRQVDLDEFASVAPEVFAAARRSRAGQMDRAARWWSRTLGRDGYPPGRRLPANWLVHDGRDGVDGLLAWTPRGDAGLLPPFHAVEVWGLFAAGEAAYRDLWAYLGGLDLVDEVVLHNRPVDEEVRWLLPDARTLVMTQHVDLLWLALLDVPAALMARRYSVPGEVVLEVVGEEPGLGGRFALRADDSEVECSPTGRAAEVVVSRRALASAYLGGFALRQLMISGAVRELAPGALARLDAMFATGLAPWNTTWF